MNIKTWRERLELPDHGLGIRAVDFAMQAEIDELRAALAARDAKHLAGLEAIALHVEALESKVAAQRRVLEQALEALKEPIGFTGCRQIDVKLKAAITAIQETLHGKD